MSRAGPTLLRGAPALADWILAGGRAAHAPPGWRWQLRWQAWWAQRLWRLQQPQLQAAAPLQDPVLVLGLWRSGTTLLHERLAALPGHQACATWQCFNPSGYLLTGAPRRATQAARRPMDGGIVRADTPQEDEFALLLQGAPSLYRGFVDPRRLGTLADAHFAPAADAPDPPWLADWLAFLAGVQQQGRGARLVLKSPNHTLRLPVLQAALPGSPQVWIGRPLSSVWLSNLRMWRAMFEQYALWPCPDGALEAFLQRCVQRYVQVLGQQLARAGERRLWVDFDDLGDAPAELQQALARFCGGAAADCSDADCATIAAVYPAHEQTTPQQALPPALQPLADEVDALHAAARQRWGWRINAQEPT